MREWEMIQTRKRLQVLILHGTTREASDMDPFRSVPILSKEAGLWTPAFISHWSEAAWAEYGHDKFLALVGRENENQGKGLQGVYLASIVELGLPKNICQC